MNQEKEFRSGAPDKTLTVETSIPPLAGAQAQVRGYSAVNRPAGSPVKILATLADLAAGALLFLVALRAFNLSPVPRLSSFLLFVGCCLGSWALPRFTVGKSVGDLIWRLSDRKGKLLQAEHLTPPVQMIATFLTTLLCLAALMAFYEFVGSHPVFARADAWKLEASLPNAGASPDQGEWIVAPFFYSMAAWPKAYQGKPIFYSLPYQKGPPTRFIGTITARWDMPWTKVTFEGPKTPGGSQPGFEAREKLRHCILDFSIFNIECLKVREAALSRHITEMRKHSLRDWSVRWFVVENEALSAQGLGEEQAQGIHIRGRNRDRIEDRIIIVTPQGTHQTIILDRPRGEAGEQAWAVFEKSLQSLRVSDDLGPGLTWANQQLARIRLEDLKSVAEPKVWLARVAEIQTLLLAKVSVDPKTYDAFYHLGGTAFMMAKYAAEHQLNEPGAAAKPMIQSAFRYAQDIAPENKRTAELQGYWLDSRKF